MKTITSFIWSGVYLHWAPRAMVEPQSLSPLSWSRLSRWSLEAIILSHTVFRTSYNKLLSSEMIWATSRENLFMPYANNKGADQPAHLISAFVVHCLGSIIPVLAISKISWHWLASFFNWAGQFESDLVETPKDRFSLDKAMWPGIVFRAVWPGMTQIILLSYRSFR